MSLKDAALVAPDVSSEKKFFNDHAMTCHMAAIFWAFRASGKSTKDSTRALKTITSALCAGCANDGANHGSLNYVGYARYFCATTHAMDQYCMVDDVVIAPDPRMPMHSMVVVEKPDLNTVMIRGFNNTNTFPAAVPAPPYMKYDPTTRNLANRASPNTNAVFYIKSMTYIRSALTALNALAA